MTKIELRSELELLFYYQYVTKTPAYKQSFLQSSLKIILSNYEKYSGGGRYIDDVRKTLSRGTVAETVTDASETLRQGLSRCLENETRTMTEVIDYLADSLWIPPFPDFHP